MSGFVLIGGRSSRLGTDKASAMLGGVPAADLLAGRLARVCGSRVRLVGRDDASWSAYPVIPDSKSGCGPLGGVATALESAQAEFALVIATDLWGITATSLEGVLVSLTDSDSDFDLVCATSEASGLQPLCAAWRVETCLAAVRRRLAAQEYSMFGLLEELCVASVTVAEIELANINDPQDLEAFLRDSTLQR